MRDVLDSDIGAIGRKSARLRLLEPIGMATWKGASGARVRHVVYTLVGCPPVASATYLLVSRRSGGKAKVLAIGHTTTATPSVNLARIRRIGAALGANEVHLHPLDGSPRRLAALAFDLETAIHPERCARNRRH